MLQIGRYASILRGTGSSFGHVYSKIFRDTDARKRFISEVCGIYSGNTSGSAGSGIIIYDWSPGPITKFLNRHRDASCRRCDLEGGDIGDCGVDTYLFYLAEKAYRATYEIMKEEFPNMPKPDTYGFVDPREIPPELIERASPIYLEELRRVVEEKYHRDKGMKITLPSGIKRDEAEGYLELRTLSQPKVVKCESFRPRPKKRIAS